MRAQVLRPGPRQRVGVQAAAPDGSRIEHRVEAGQSSVAVADDREGLGVGRPPLGDQGGGSRRLLKIADLVNGRFVAGARRLDHIGLGGTGEERLAHRRVLDQIQGIGGVSPQLGRRGRGHLRAQLQPGRLAVGPVATGIGGAQRRGADLTNCVVQDQPFAARLHERQRCEPVERVRRR